MQAKAAPPRKGFKDRGKNSAPTLTNVLRGGGPGGAVLLAVLRVRGVQVADLLKTASHTHTNKNTQYSVIRR